MQIKKITYRNTDSQILQKCIVNLYRQWILQILFDGTLTSLILYKTFLSGNICSKNVIEIEGIMNIHGVQFVLVQMFKTEWFFFAILNVLQVEKHPATE